MLPSFYQVVMVFKPNNLQSSKNKATLILTRIYQARTYLMSLLVPNSPNFAVSEKAGWKVKWRAGVGICG
jgi:hypothetical protein